MYRNPRSGLNLTLFRAYEPRLGRWLSKDPLAEQTDTNVFSYVGNAPTNYIDPLGLQPADPVPWAELPTTAIAKSIGGSGHIIAKVNLNVKTGSYILLDSTNPQGAFYVGKGDWHRAGFSKEQMGFPDRFWTPCNYSNNPKVPPKLKATMIEAERIQALGGPNTIESPNFKLPYNKIWPPFRRTSPAFGGGGAGVGIGGLGGPIFSNYVLQYAFPVEI